MAKQLYRFDCLDKRGNVLAEGIGVHAESMEEAETAAQKLMEPGESKIRFRNNNPCVRKCRICAASKTTPSSGEGA